MLLDHVWDCLKSEHRLFPAAFWHSGNFHRDDDYTDSFHQWMEWGNQFSQTKPFSNTQTWQEQEIGQSPIKIGTPISISIFGAEYEFVDVPIRGP